MRLIQVGRLYPNIVPRSSIEVDYVQLRTYVSRNALNEEISDLTKKLLFVGKSLKYADFLFDIS